MIELFLIAKKIFGKTDIINFFKNSEKYHFIMSTTAFSSSDVTVLERVTDHDSNEQLELHQIWNETHKKVCSDWIKQNGYKNVCLQFPDDFLVHSVAISDSLKAAVDEEAKIFILGDTSYGSCCVDEIAASHVDADSLIHFGNACRSKISRLPVLYMFPELDLNVMNFIEKVHRFESIWRDKQVCVYLDIGYHKVLEKSEEVETDEAGCLRAKLREILPYCKIHVEVYPYAEDTKCEYVPLEDRVCIFIGSDNNRFANLSLTSKAAHWFIYDPKHDSLNEKNPLTANYIRRRFFYIEKCKDAQTLGLIVATLTADGFLEVVKRIQEMAKQRGKKTQIVSVGRINPAKLANFMEIDCFVLIGCPFNNAYTSKDYYKPIVSVFEAEMALNPAWHMKYPEAYVTDFKELLPQGRQFMEFNAADINEQDVSLVSGRVRNATASHDDISVADTTALNEQQRTLITQNKRELMATSTGLTFEDRTWKGLEQALGCTEPAKLQKGLSGIPIKYTHD